MRERDHEVWDDFGGDYDFADLVDSIRTHAETADVVRALDAEWFLTNPGNRRIRHYVPGEFDNGNQLFNGMPTDLVVMVTRGGQRIFFPIGGFTARDWPAGGIG